MLRLTVAIVWMLGLAGVARASELEDALLPLTIAARTASPDARAAVLADACSRAGTRCDNGCDGLHAFALLPPAERAAAMIGCPNFDAVRAGGDAAHWVEALYLDYVDRSIAASEREPDAKVRAVLACDRQKLGFDPREPVDDKLCSALLDVRRPELPAAAVSLLRELRHLEPDDLARSLATSCMELDGCAGACLEALAAVAHGNEHQRSAALATCKAFDARRDGKDLSGWMVRYVGAWIDRDLEKNMTAEEREEQRCLRSKLGDGDPALARSARCAKVVR